MHEKNLKKIPKMFKTVALNTQLHKPYKEITNYTLFPIFSDFFYQPDNIFL